MPNFVQLEVTTKCNLKCKYCLRNSDPSKVVTVDMSFDLFKRIISQLKGRTPDVSLVGLGEPLLNPDIFSMICFIKQRSGIEVSLIDNFMLINRENSLALIDSGLDYLYVSFDHVAEEEFEERRTGANFKNIVSNIKLFLNTRKEVNAKKPLLFFKSTIESKNFSQIPQLIKFVEDIGADGINFGKMIDFDAYGIKSPPLLNKKDVPKTNIMVDPCELSKSYECDATRGLYVTFDGRVLPCGLMAEWVYRSDYPQVQLGDLTKETIDQVWRSKRFRELRKNIHTGKYLPQCGTCGGATKH